MMMIRPRLPSFSSLPSLLSLLSSASIAVPVAARGGAARPVVRRDAQRGGFAATLLVIIAVLAIAALVAWQAGWLANGPGGGLAGGSASGSASGSAGGSEKGRAGASSAGPAAAAVTPALTITTTRPLRQAWSRTLGAQGSISAWQEAVIGAEVGGMRIAEVRVNVGDAVRRGDVLATLVPTTLANDLASQEAAAAEARAALAEARANAERARKLQDTGAISSQQVNQYLTAEQTARARVNAAEARIRTDRLRLSQASLQAPDDGVISARLATPGAVAQAGQELFRLIRGGRLEWRAEVPAADLGRITVGMPATVTLPDGSDVEGRTRVVAPTVDPMTRNGLVYVDLPASASRARAGMFARGRFDIGQAEALTLPAAAVTVRDGFAWVFRVERDSTQGDRVIATRVGTGRRNGDRIEITDGLKGDEAIAATGVGFLADGDVVSVVTDTR